MHIWQQPQLCVGFRGWGDGVITGSIRKAGKQRAAKEKLKNVHFWLVVWPSRLVQSKKAFGSGLYIPQRGTWGGSLIFFVEKLFLRNTLLKISSSTSFFQLSWSSFPLHGSCYIFPIQFLLHIPINYHGHLPFQISMLICMDCFCFCVKPLPIMFLLVTFLLNCSQ